MLPGPEERTHPKLNRDCVSGIFLPFPVSTIKSKFLLFGRCPTEQLIGVRSVGVASPSRESRRRVPGRPRREGKMNMYVKMVKSVVLAAAAVVLFTLSQGVARADEVTVAGLSGGCFSNPPSSPCPPPLPGGVGPSQTATLVGLHYNGSSFQVTTVNGLAGVGSSASPPNNFNNFGSFTLDSTPYIYNGARFVLRIAFSLPPGTAPGSALFTADIVGSVSNTNSGGVQITFHDPQTQDFLFDGGHFALTINSLAITGGQGPVPLTGFIQAQSAPIPEPATVLLLGTGLAGLAARFRKRKNSLRE